MSNFLRISTQYVITCLILYNLPAAGMDMDSLKLALIPTPKKLQVSMKQSSLMDMPQEYRPKTTHIPLVCPISLKEFETQFLNQLRTHDLTDGSPTYNAIHTVANFISYGDTAKGDKWGLPKSVLLVIKSSLENIMQNMKENTSKAFPSTETEKANMTQMLNTLDIFLATCLQESADIRDITLTSKK
jgi:hypothetical protein